MDPASLVVAALVYVAITTAQKITEQFGTATAQGLQRLVEAVYAKVRGAPEAEAILRDWEKDPNDTQRRAALVALIRQLIREDQRFSRQLEQLQNELRARLDEQRREFGELEARVLRPAVAPVPPPPPPPTPGGTEPGPAPTPASAAVPAPVGDGMEGIKHRLFWIIETLLPAGQADALTATLVNAQGDLADTLAGSRDSEDVDALAQEAVNASTATRQAIAALQARILRWIDGQ